MNPTDEQRRLVKSLAAVGTIHAEIAPMVGIRSDKTLRKHFRDELDRGSVEANANVARKLYEMATSGECPAATIFWLKCRAGWKEKPKFEPAATPLPPLISPREEGVQPS